MDRNKDISIERNLLGRYRQEVKQAYGNDTLNEIRKLEEKRRSTKSKRLVLIIDLKIVKPNRRNIHPLIA